MKIRGKMYRVGVFPGKFMPPHKGHLSSIQRAAAQYEKLYVVVSDNNDYMERVCKENNIRPMSLELRAEWVSKELRDLKNVKVLILDETGIPAYPEGTKFWSKLLVAVMPEKFDVLFGGEERYRKTYSSNFPDIEYVVFDSDRTSFPISATMIRKDPQKHRDYILDSARSHFDIGL